MAVFRFNMAPLSCLPESGHGSTHVGGNQPQGDRRRQRVFRQSPDCGASHSCPGRGRAAHREQRGGSCLLPDSRRIVAGGGKGDLMESQSQGLPQPPRERLGHPPGTAGQRLSAPRLLPDHGWWQQGGSLQSKLPQQTPKQPPPEPWAVGGKRRLRRHSAWPSAACRVIAKSLGTCVETYQK